MCEDVTETQERLCPLPPPPGSPYDLREEVRRGHDLDQGRPPGVSRQPQSDADAD